MTTALALVSLCLCTWPSTTKAIDSVPNVINDPDPSLVWTPVSSLCDVTMQEPLGLESRSIADSALSASSSYNEQSVGPQLARLNSESAGGAWCPSPQLDIDNSGSEWIQVNLSAPFVITAISTQGRFGNGVGVEFVDEFWLEYSRDFGKTWHKWKSRKGSHVSVHLDGRDADTGCAPLTARSGRVPLIEQLPVSDE